MSIGRCCFGMDRFEFDAKVEGEGYIRIPDEYVKSLGTDKPVHITISDEPQERLTVKLMRENPLDLTSVESLPPGSRRTRLVERMIEHPFHDPDFKPLSREEIYDRGRDRNP